MVVPIIWTTQRLIPDYFYIFVIKPKDALIFPNLFLSRNSHVSGSSSVHHQEFSTIHSALVYVMQGW